jgi:DNA-binding transcriptional MerR regulator
MGEAIRRGRADARSGGQRLYADADIERLQLLVRATGAGRQIGQVAALSNEELRALIEGDERAARINAALAPGGPAVESLLSSALIAVEEFDGHRSSSSTLRSAALRLPADDVLDQVIGPLLFTIGSLWHQGLLLPGQRASRDHDDPPRPRLDVGPRGARHRRAGGGGGNAGEPAARTRRDARGDHGERATAGAWSTSARTSRRRSSRARRVSPGPTRSRSPSSIPRTTARCPASCAGCARSSRPGTALVVGGSGASARTRRC